MDLTSQKTSSASPVDLRSQSLSLNNRIIGYDLARAVALLGMLLVNFSVLLGNGTSDPTWLDHLIEMIRGRAAATFVVLAGVGLSLFSKTVYLNNDLGGISKKRLALHKRSLFLLVIGLLNFAVSPLTDILHFYALYLVLGAWLLTASNLSFWVLTLAIIIARPFSMTAFAFVKAWELNPNAVASFWNLPGIFGHMFFTGCYPVIPWLAFVILGMWIGRVDLSKRALQKKIFLAGGGAVILAESVSRVLMYMSASGQVELNLLPWCRVVAWDPMPLFMFSAAGTALLVIGMCAMVAEKRQSARWILPLVGVGQTSLTLYVLHVIFSGVLLYLISVHEMELSPSPVWTTLVFYLAALVFSSYWLRHFQKGPLELLMRRFLVFSRSSKVALQVQGFGEVGN